MAKPRYVYRVLTRSGVCWCETSDPDEARRVLAEVGAGGKLERCYSTVVWSSWEHWNGADDGA